jgi:hypothetical protein
MIMLQNSVESTQYVDVSPLSIHVTYFEFSDHVKECKMFIGDDGLNSWRRGNVWRVPKVEIKNRFKG